MANIERKPHENCRTLLEIADRSCEQGQYIDVNLAASSERDKKTVGSRPHNSSDSQDFEFDLHLGFASNSSEPPQTALAPADELFYQGQLLPLERDSRVHLTFSDEGQLESDVTASCLVFSSRDQDMSKCSSCRMDAIALDPSVVNFRCSSFRSHFSDHWESSGDKGTGDISSSLDSTGSSQDSCCTGDKEVPGHCAQSAKSSLGQSRLRPAGALNLKSFFGGLKKVFKAMGELSSNEIVWSADPSRPGPSSSSSRRGAENLYGHEAGKGLLKRVNSSKPNAFSAMDAKQEEREIRVSKVESGSAFWRSKAGAGRIEGEIEHRSAWQRYTRKLKPLYTKMLQRQGGGGLLSSHQLRPEDCDKACAIVSSNRLERHFSQSSYWPGDYRENWSCSSSRFLAIASCPPSVRSSPNNSGVLAAITKSPENRPAPTFNSLSNMSMSASTMQELHSAVQGAIAHCKESISGTPAPLVSPSAAVP